MICEGALVCDECRGKRFVQPTDLVVESMRSIEEQFVNQVLSDSEKKLVELLVEDQLACKCEFMWTEDGVLNVKPIRVVEKICLRLKVGETVEVLPW